MTEKIKDSLRIKHSALDAEITDLVAACKADLRRVGIEKIEDDDALIIQVAKLYVRWQMNFESEADRYRKAYEMLRNALSMCGEYNV